MEDIAARWPPDADHHQFLAELWNDLIESGNPATTKMYIPMLAEAARILESAPQDIDEVRAQLEEVVRKWDEGLLWERKRGQATF